MALLALALLGFASAALALWLVSERIVMALIWRRSEVRSWHKERGETFRSPLDFQSPRSSAVHSLGCDFSYSSIAASPTRMKP